MQIANPIYDAAFKYLMQDDRAARLLVGRIAGLDIESLELRPQELAAPRAASPRDDGEVVQAPLALFRMDFAARVRTPDGGERQVLIEIQKTNAPTVVERFRAYLGQQLCSPANIIEHPSGRREAAPIVTIYLLGYDLGLSDEAVLVPQGTDPAGSRRDHSKHDMTNNAPTGNGTNVRWIEDTLGELLDEEGGNSVDEQAFENAKRAAREFGAAVNKLENPRNRTPQKIADLCGTAFEHGALFGAVVVNHEMRKELLRHREYPGDQECAKRLATFHSRHMETLAEEFENQLKVDRVGKLVRGTLVKAKKAIRLTRMWE